MLEKSARKAEHLTWTLGCLLLALAGLDEPFVGFRFRQGYSGLFVIFTEE